MEAYGSFILISKIFVRWGPHVFLLKESEQGKERDCWHHKAAQTAALYLEAHELGMTSLQATSP
jgi:hypothetical protein